MAHTETARPNLQHWLQPASRSDPGPQVVQPSLQPVLDGDHQPSKCPHPHYPSLPDPRFHYQSQEPVDSKAGRGAITANAAAATEAGWSAVAAVAAAAARPTVCGLPRRTFWIAVVVAGVLLVVLVVGGGVAGALVRRGDSDGCLRESLLGPNPPRPVPSALSSHPATLKDGTAIVAAARTDTTPAGSVADTDSSDSSDSFVLIYQTTTDALYFVRAKRWLAGKPKPLSCDFATKLHIPLAALSCVDRVGAIAPTLRSSSCALGCRCLVAGEDGMAAGNSNCAPSNTCRKVKGLQITLSHPPSRELRANPRKCCRGRSVRFQGLWGRELKRRLGLRTRNGFQARDASGGLGRAVHGGREKPGQVKAFFGSAIAHCLPTIASSSVTVYHSQLGSIMSMIGYGGHCTENIHIANKQVRIHISLVSRGKA